MTVIASVVYSNLLRASNQFAIYTTPLLLLPVLLIVLLPCTLGYSIFRYRLMDIDLVVKRSLLYAIVTTVLAGLYLLLVYLIGTTLSYALGTEESQIGNLFAFVVLAFAFDPLKRKAQDWIDRFFYQERYNYQRALLELSQELPSKIHLDEILNLIISRISTTMHVEKVAVVLCDEKEGCTSASKNIRDEDCGFGRDPGGLLALLRDTRGPRSFALLANEPEYYQMNEADKGRLSRSGVVLSVPMFLQARLIGAINVGLKSSGKVYSQEDIDLLSTVAGQAAIAVENARLHKSEVESQRIVEELALTRHIQQGLLPKSNPNVEGLDISGVSIPAQTVGGDYFDYIRLGPDRLLVVVGDVSGKGVSAALYMSKIQGMIQVIAPMYRSSERNADPGQSPDLRQPREEVFHYDDSGALRYQPEGSLHLPCRPQPGAHRDRRNLRVSQRRRNWSWIGERTVVRAGAGRSQEAARSEQHLRFLFGWIDRSDE